MSDGPRILLIDSYDSFTFNLAALCKRAIPDSHVHIVKNDALSSSALPPILEYFDAIVVGPGPGSPEIQEDIGIVRSLWHVPDDLLVPVFGVCLGLQSLAIEHGGQIKRLGVVKHGQVYSINHLGTDIFQDVGDVKAVRYHSLHIKLKEDSTLVPLAWADDGEDNGSVLMAIRHSSKPFWAVQYHPESVCTEGGGEDVLRNFWRLASQWSRNRRRTTLRWNQELESLVGPTWPSIRPQAIAKDGHHSALVSTRSVQRLHLDIPRICQMLGAEDDCADFAMLESAASPGRFSIIACLSPTSLKVTYTVGNRSVRLQRGTHVDHESLGSLDIWAWLAGFLRARKAHGGLPEVPFWGGLVGFLSYELGVDTITPLPTLSTSRNRHPDVNLVFVERSIVVDLKSGAVHVQSIIPDDDAWLRDMARKLEAFDSPATDRSVKPPMKLSAVNGHIPSPVITLPNRDSYISKIVAAKEWLSSGDSYELCVTAPTRVIAPKALSAVARGTSSSWALYKTLRTRNPAPHSGFIRLHPSTLLSSSPERFLSYARPPDGLCQLRPIKGTVRKAPGITRAIAEEMLAGSTKEVAENLMIVDLIRHDLHSVLGEDVQVKQFCRVEEYETVWQLVSVIEGRPAATVQEKTHSDMGWEVLRATLPPGSMTGAPKKRSVEILHQLEGAERGIYSGVVGYADVGGGGDWAVIIRSCFKHHEHAVPSQVDVGRRGPQVVNEHSHGSFDTDSVPQGGYANSLDEKTSSIARSLDHCTFNGAAQTYDRNLMDEWTLGAGGAITALSDPVAEWDEMLAKVESVLRAFGDPI